MLRLLIACSIFRHSVRIAGRITLLELLTLVCWAAALGIQALGVGTQQARVVVAISIVVPMATAPLPPVVVMVVVVMAA